MAFKEVKDEQPENIFLISSTLLVLKLYKSKKIKEEQQENILFMFETLLVLKFDKFRI